MIRLFAVVGLFTVAFLNQAEGHRYKSAKYRQYFDVKEVEKESNWTEARGYAECEEKAVTGVNASNGQLIKDLLNFPYNSYFTENTPTVKKARNGQDHLLKSHKPKPIDESCRKYKCPAHEKINPSECGFETRNIAGAYWAVTDVNMTSPEGLREAYIRLHRYRGGKYNDRGQRMDIANPVVKEYWLDDNSNVELVRMGFHIPEEFQSDPPKSNSTEVIIEKWSKHKIYSRTYGGYMEDQDFLQQFELLKEALKTKGVTPCRKLMVVAGYTHHGFGRQRLEAILVEKFYESC